MNWFEAAPIALVTVAWLLLPGAAVGYLAGLRGIAAWAIAPVMSIALIAGTAVLAEMIGIDWSVWIVLIVCAAAIAVTLLLRRKTIFTAGADPRSVTLAGFAGLVPALVLGTISVVRSITTPDALSQTYDALFHYNALAYIEDSHKASSLTLAAFGNPDLPGVFYPAAWHDLASLLMMSTGTSIPVAANVVSVVAAVVLWPLSCLFLVRQLFGRNTGALAITGVLSMGFAAFPWDLLGFGVLWPNLLGMALAPAVLAVVFTVTGWAKDGSDGGAIGRGRAWLTLPVVLVATGLTHPNVLFSVAVLSLFPVAAAIGARGWRLHRAGRTWRGAAEFTAFVLVVGLVWFWAARTPAFAEVRETYWPPFSSPANAFGEVALNATNKYDALWLLSAVVLAGIVAATRFTVLWLVVAGHLATTFLYVIAAAIQLPATWKFTGFWYNDSHRLAAMVPITAVPLAVGGLLLIAHFATKLARRAIPDAYVAVGLAALLLVLTAGLYPADRERRVAEGYDTKKVNLLATTRMVRFYTRIKDEIPEDALVAGNPFNGSAMLWTLADREVLFPHFRSEHSREQTILAGHLDEAGTEPEVCRAVRTLGVDFLLVGGLEFRTYDPHWSYYQGVDDPGTAPGFVLVDSDGPFKLYRITACGNPAT